MKTSELTVTINAKLDVDRKTAETCLRLVEAYVNANPVELVCHKQENGELEFEYFYNRGAVMDAKTFVERRRKKEEK